MKRETGRGFFLCFLIAAAGGVACCGEPLPPEATRYNLRLGSQAFGARYQFTTNSAVVEQAGHLVRMGSDIAKFAIAAEPRRKEQVPLAAFVQGHPEYTRLFDMPFRHYFLWVNGVAAPGNYWRKGVDEEKDREEYGEIHALTRHLLTRYSGTGKSFYLGNWEGDWLLLGTGDRGTNNPPPEAVLGMRAWLNARQRAVDDATRTTPHREVNVFAYVEVNRVRDALLKKPGADIRIVNAVLPFVPELDYVSYSSYDAQNLAEPELFRTLDYIAANLSTNKAAVLPGRRVFIGEYGFGGGGRVPEQQLVPTRDYLARVLRWGVPFALFWQVYNNEPGNFFCLIDERGRPTPCYELHRRYLPAARQAVGGFWRRHRRVPTDDEFTALALPLLESAGAEALRADAP